MISSAALCLALAIHFEARGEPLTDQIATGETVMWRVNSPRYPDGVCGVVFQPGQFHGPLKHWREGMAIPRFTRKTITAVNYIYSDQPVICGSEFFHASSSVPDGGTIVCQFHGHTYYNLTRGN